MTFPPERVVSASTAAMLAVPSNLTEGKKHETSGSSTVSHEIHSKGPCGLSWFTSRQNSKALTRDELLGLGLEGHMLSSDETMDDVLLTYFAEHPWNILEPKPMASSRPLPLLEPTT